MNMTKRDIADIALVWMALRFLLSLLAGLTALGTYLGMTEQAMQYTDRSTAVTCQVVNILALLLLNYVLLFKRTVILSLVFPDGGDREVSIPSGLSAIASYAFWIRLLGIFTFLSSGTRFLGRLSMDIADTSQFVAQAFWMHRSGEHLVSTVLAAVVIWKADWIADKLGKQESSDKNIDSHEA